MRKTRKSSDRQKEIFQFIKAFLLEKGYPPSVREIGEAVGLKSSSTVHGYLSRLEANGMIKRDPTKPRAIDILDERPWRQNVPVPMLMGIHKGGCPVQREEHPRCLLVPAGHARHPQEDVPVAHAR